MSDKKLFNELTPEEQLDLTAKLAGTISSMGYPAETIITPLFAIMVSTSVALGVPRVAFLSACSSTFDKAVGDLSEHVAAEKNTDDTEPSV